MAEPAKPPRKRYASAVAAARALPPMTPEEIAVVTRILAQVERRRAEPTPKAHENAA